MSSRLALKKLKSLLVGPKRVYQTKCCACVYRDYTSLGNKIAKEFSIHLEMFLGCYGILFWVKEVAVNCKIL